MTVVRDEGDVALLVRQSFSLLKLVCLPKGLSRIFDDLWRRTSLAIPVSCRHGATAQRRPLHSLAAPTSSEASDVMKVLPSTDPVVMSLRSTSGCFGVLAMLMGAVLVVSVFAPGAGRGGDDMPWYIGLPFGLGLLAAGTYRRTIRIDWNSGNVIHRKSLVGYAFQQTTYSLDAFDTVYLGHIRRHSGDSTTSKYHATLRGSSSLTIMESGIVKQSRTVAESVAVFLHVKLIDSVTGHVIVREPGLLQLSVGQRAQNPAANSRCRKLPLTSRRNWNS